MPLNLFLKTIVKNVADFGTGQAGIALQKEGHFLKIILHKKTHIIKMKTFFVFNHCKIKKFLN